MSSSFGLNAHVGQTLRLGGRNFKIAAVLRQEPDRISAGAGMGPRVMISSAALDRTGILGPGSRASHRLLLKLPDQLPKGVDTVKLRKQVEEALGGDAQVIDYREGNPGLTEGLDRATAILSLICLVAMVLGAIGVAMAMHAHLEQRMDMLAILKAVGAGSPDLLRIFLLQTLGLGFAGGLLGVAAGLGVMEALPAVFGKLIPVHITLEFPWRSVLAGMGTGLLTTLAVLPASAARCARNPARAGAAAPGRAAGRRHRRLVRARVGAPPATGLVDRRGARAGRHRVGLVGFGHHRQFVCVRAGRGVVRAAGAGCGYAAKPCALSSTACGCTCRLLCAMGWRIFIGPAISPRRCWPRWARA